MIRVNVAITVRNKRSVGRLSNITTEWKKTQRQVKGTVNERSTSKSRGIRSNDWDWEERIGQNRDFSTTATKTLVELYG